MEAKFFIDRGIEEIRRAQTLNQTSLALLSTALPILLIREAIRISENKGIKQFTTIRKKRNVYIVRTSRHQYRILPPMVFCPCDAYDRALKDLDVYLCKHLLALKISESLNMIPVETIEDEDFAYVYMNIS